MRDFLAAVRDHVVVFDGGMGATLEQFDLSLEQDYRLPGRCHEALVLNRPDLARLGADQHQAVADWVRDRDALLVLDNCEHVVDAVAALAGRLLDAAPGLRILSTSQVALGVDGAVARELAPLGLSDAVELFSRRAAPRYRDGADDAGAKLETYWNTRHGALVSELEGHAP